MENYYLILSEDETCSESDDESLGTPSPRINNINNNFELFDFELFDFELFDQKFIIGFILGYISKCLV